MKIYELIEMFNKKVTLPSYLQKKKFHNPNNTRTKKIYTILGFSFDNSLWKTNKENSIYLYITGINLKKLLHKLLICISIFVFTYWFCWDELMYLLTTQFYSIYSFLSIIAMYLSQYISIFNLKTSINGIKKFIYSTETIETEITQNGLNEKNTTELLKNLSPQLVVEVKKKPLKRKLKAWDDSNTNIKVKMINPSKHVINDSFDLKKIKKNELNVANGNIIQNNIKSSKFNQWLNKYSLITSQALKDLFSLNVKSNNISSDVQYKIINKVNALLNFKYLENKSPLKKNFLDSSLFYTNIYNNRTTKSTKFRVPSAFFFKINMIKTLDTSFLINNAGSIKKNLNLFNFTNFVKKPLTTKINLNNYDFIVLIKNVSHNLTILSKLKNRKKKSNKIWWLFKN